MSIRWRKILKESIPHWTGIHAYRTLPQGVDLFFDLKRLLPCYSAKVIFDIGANVGQSATEFVQHYPAARVYCFEPAAATFNQLQESFRSYSNVRCFPLAFGDKSGEAKMALHENSVFNRIALEGQTSNLGSSATETIEIQTLVKFCQDHQIECIDLLKIDTEGQDLRVLEGGAELLDNERIHVVQVEAGMNPTNTLHVPFQQFVEYLEPRGYLLFGFYEQTHEQMLGGPQLRRSNPVFISQRVMGMPR